MNLLILSPADSLNQVQMELAAVAEKLTTTPANELFSELIDKAIAFGLKLLAAFVIYLIESQGYPDKDL